MSENNIGPNSAGSPSETKLTRFNTFSIVAISVLWLFEVSAVAPALGPLSQAFPAATPLEIRMVMCAPFLTIFVFSNISGGILARHFDKKKIVIIGLAIYAVTGILPGFATSISAILVLRFLTGVGVGMIVPHSNTIISQHFTGKIRERLLGLNMSVANLGNVVVSFVISALLVLGWQYAFFSFIFVLVILVLVVIGVPKSMPYKEDKPETGEAVQKPKVLMAVLPIALLLAFVSCIFGFGPTNLSMYLVQNNMAPVWSLGIIMSFAAIGGVVGGIIVPEFMKLFKRYLTFVSLVIAAVGFFLLYAFPTIPAVIAGGFFVGLAMQGLIPPMIFEMTARKTALDQRDTAYGIVNSSMYIGSFAGPFLQDLISAAGHNPSISFIFLAGAVIMLISLVVALIVAIVAKKGGLDQSVQ